MDQAIQVQVIASLLLLYGDDIVSIMSQSLMSIMYDDDDDCGCIMHDMWYDYCSIHDDDGCYIEMHDDDDDDRYKLLNSKELH